MLFFLRVGMRDNVRVVKALVLLAARKSIGARGALNCSANHWGKILFKFIEHRAIDRDTHPAIIAVA